MADKITESRTCSDLWPQKAKGGIDLRSGEKEIASPCTWAPAGSPAARATS